MEGLKRYLGSVEVPSLASVRSGEFLARYLRRPDSNSGKSDTNVISDFEDRLVAIQEIIIWSNPLRSVRWLIFTQMFLYQFCLSSTPLVSSVAYTCLSAYLYLTWRNRIWPTIRLPSEHPEDCEKWTPLHPDTLSAPEIEKVLNRIRTRGNQIYSGLWLLRAERPLTFCLILSTFFILLASLGGRFSTPFLLHSTGLLVFLLPPLLTRLARNSSVYPFLLFAAEFFASLTNLLVYRGQEATPQEHHDLDEFLPEDGGKSREELEIAERFPVYTAQEQVDSLTLSLSADLTIPSHDEVDLDSLTTTDLETDLLPSRPAIGYMEVSDEDSDSDLIAGPIGRIRDAAESSESDDSFRLPASSSRRGRRGRAAASPPTTSSASSVTTRLMSALSTAATASLAASASSSSSSSATMLLQAAATAAIGPDTATAASSRRSSQESDLADFELISEQELELESP